MKPWSSRYYKRTHFYHSRNLILSKKLDSLACVDAPQSSFKIYDRVSAASCWENRSKAVFTDLKIICLRHFKKWEKSKASLDVCSNDMSFPNATANCSSLFVLAEKLDQNLTLYLDT